MKEEFTLRVSEEIDLTSSEAILIRMILKFVVSELPDLG
jgi:hypothetical protein